MQFYSEEEMLVALTKARVEIDRRAEFAGEYKRGFNDCLAFFVLYDQYLRGDESRAENPIVFEWDSTKEFVQKLYLRGHTIESYAEYCGYHIVKKGRPLYGDVGFEKGAMICDGDFWLSTDETNKGVMNKRQTKLMERHIVHARPIRS